MMSNSEMNLYCDNINNGCKGDCGLRHGFTPCTHFKNGHCTKGKKCKFLHTLQSKKRKSEIDFEKYINKRTRNNSEDTEDTDELLKENELLKNKLKYQNSKIELFEVLLKKEKSKNNALIEQLRIKKSTIQTLETNKSVLKLEKESLKMNYEELSLENDDLTEQNSILTSENEDLNTHITSNQNIQPIQNSQPFYFPNYQYSMYSNQYL